jgi:hypothetical protein
MKTTHKVLGRLLVGSVLAGCLTAKLHAIELAIETDDDNATRVIHFDTMPGFIYNVEESTNLLNWSLMQSVVARDTNYIFSTAATGKKFYRVAQPDDRISFPGWDDYVEAFAYFNVSTTIQGTYHLELYGDGGLLYQNTAAVPASGNFGVYDGSYDPAQWPNVGGYAIENWELRVTVSPIPTANNPNPPPAQQTLKKIQRQHTTSPRFGLTVEREGVGAGVAPGVQDNIDEYMVGYLQMSGFNVASQRSLAGTFIDPNTAQPLHVPKLTDSNSWTQFKIIVTNYNYTDLHYYGHGSRQGIGDNLSDPTTSIALSIFQITNRVKHPFRYAAMDGCQTASGDWWQTSKLLAALCGFDKKLTAYEASSQGKWPRFAWGWTTKKIINFGNGTYLNSYHFIFIADIYKHLAERNPSGFLEFTFDEAIEFALHPNHHGSDPSITDNPDGHFLGYLGCGDARWDD